jgi:DNA polymerase I-like protein with 3'-5' exonuclease and polymerase domains
MVPVGSCTKITNMQMYDNQGFVNKNTGADIIRIDLCKFKRLFDTDPEWAANVRFACTIHDECNFYVKEEYLRTAVRKIYETMYFEHPLMALPLKASVSIGEDWGHLIEVDIKKFL